MNTPDSVTLPKGWRIESCVKEPPKWLFWIAILSNGKRKSRGTGDTPLDAIADAAERVNRLWWFKKQWKRLMNVLR